MTCQLLQKCWTIIRNLSVDLCLSLSIVETRELASVQSMSQSMSLTWIGSGLDVSLFNPNPIRTVARVQDKPRAKLPLVGLLKATHISSSLYVQSYGACLVSIYTTVDDETWILPKFPFNPFKLPAHFHVLDTYIALHSMHAPNFIQ